MPEIINSDNQFTWEDKSPEAAEKWWTQYRAWYNDYKTENENDWQKRLLVVGTQGLAQLALLEYQAGKYDEIEERRVEYLDAAIAEWNNCLDMLTSKIKDATDDVPEPAMYQPVSPSGEQWQTAQDNLEIACHSKKYIEYLNETHREQDIIRAAVLNPKHYEINEVVWCDLYELSKGNITEAQVVQSITRSKEQALGLGRLGRSGRQTARDLGLLSYQVKKMARDEIRQERASQNRDISPISKQADLREMMLTPVQRIGVAIQQGQLLQQSAQNAYNACAKKSPHLLAEIQMGINKCQTAMQLQAGKSGLVNSFVPNYQATFGGIINQAIGEIGSGLFGGSINTNNNNAGTPNPLINAGGGGNYSAKGGIGY